MSQPFEVFGSQDLKDDDGAVIDSFFVETDAPPNPADAPQPITVVSLPTPPKPGRLLTGSYSFTTATVSPIQILPADAKRTSVVLRAFSSAASPSAEVEKLFVADENGKCASSSGSFVLRHSSTAVPTVLENYTGALWVLPNSGLTAAMELTWVAVTE